MQNLRNRSLCLLALCAGGLLHAQQGGDAATLAGKVLDQVGKPIQSATVVVKNDAGAAPRTITTDSDGRFSASGLPVGVYTIEATALGFAKNTRAGIQLSAGKAEDIPITLTIESLSQSVIVSETVSVAVQEAPSGNTLDATSAKTEISGAFIKTFDGIPFEDTNSPTHHSWANFPAMWLGGTDFDRSPGTVSEFGPTNFGGSINLLSTELQPDMDIRATISYGSWDTRLLSLDFDTGQFGAGNKYITPTIVNGKVFVGTTNGVAVFGLLP